jgi:hypothetical protein
MTKYMGKRKKPTPKRKAPNHKKSPEGFSLFDEDNDDADDCPEDTVKPADPVMLSSVLPPDVTHLKSAFSPCFKFCRVCT